jgi:flagellar FliL protein
MTGNPGLDKIILGLNAVIMSAAVGMVYYAHNVISPLATDQNAELGTMIENSMTELEKPPVVYDEIIVNLYSREARLRFLNTQMNIVLFEEQDRNLVMILKPYVFDALIDIAGNMKPKELNSVTGKILLEKRVKDRINTMSSLPRPMIKKILFSKFIIQ